ncbi:MAG TPA: hypothetical protein VK684_04330, partial [Edaphobacter sp.]|nr:hypothetical protein [Edaphobacter sp.]
MNSGETEVAYNPVFGQEGIDCPMPKCPYVEKPDGWAVASSNRDMTTIGQFMSMLVPMHPSS